MWNYIADNPREDKESAFHKIFTEDEKEHFKMHYCAACTYACNVIGGPATMEIRCRHCPLDSPWIDEDGEMACLDGLFEEWLSLHDILITKKYSSDGANKILMNEISETARKIANIPVKEGIEYE